MVRIKKSRNIDSSIFRMSGYSVGLFRHDFYKLKLFIQKIEKISINIGDISPIYRYFTDISDTKYRFVKKLKKKPKKKNDTSRYIADISTSVGQFNFFFLIFDPMAMVLGHMKG